MISRSTDAYFGGGIWRNALSAASASVRDGPAADIAGLAADVGFIPDSDALLRCRKVKPE